MVVSPVMEENKEALPPSVVPLRKEDEMALRSNTEMWKVNPGEPPSLRTGGGFLGFHLWEGRCGIHTYGDVSERRPGLHKGGAGRT